MFRRAGEDTLTLSFDGRGFRAREGERAASNRDVGPCEGAQPSPPSMTSTK